MYHYKLIPNLRESLSEEWDRFAAKTLGEYVHPLRRKTYISSREALRLALQNYSIEARVDEMQLENFHFLKNWPFLTCSVSHSKSAGAAVVGERSEYKALGIDIEREDRLIKKEVSHLIAHPLDMELKSVELWCLKEAAYKCLMNSGQGEIHSKFSEILISEDRWSHGPSGLTGGWELKRSEQHVIALAYLFSTPKTTLCKTPVHNGNLF